MLAHWNNSPRVYMSLHSATLSWLLGNRSVVCLVEKQQIPMLVFGLTRPGIEPTMYRTRVEHANHYTTDAAMLTTGCSCIAIKHDKRLNKSLIYLDMEHIKINIQESKWITQNRVHLTLIEQELLTVPEHLSSLSVFSGVRVTRSLVLYVCFVTLFVSFSSFSFDHCVVCSSSIYGFWLPPFGILDLRILFKPFGILELRILITLLVS